MSAKALVVLADGFEDVEAVTPVDVLRRGGVEVVTASLSGDRKVRSAHGITMLADAPFADASKDDFDAIVLPGGGEGTQNLRASSELIERLRRQKEESRLICAICAAPLVLVDAGVLDDGQHITCYPTCALDLDRRCASVPCVADGNIITGQAPGAAMLFSFVVLSALTDKQTAAKVARGMVTDILD